MSDCWFQVLSFAIVRIDGWLDMQTEGAYQCDAQEPSRSFCWRYGIGLTIRPDYISRQLLCCFSHSGEQLAKSDLESEQIVKRKRPQQNRKKMNKGSRCVVINPFLDLNWSFGSDAAFMSSNGRAKKCARFVVSLSSCRG